MAGRSYVRAGCGRYCRPPKRCRQLAHAERHRLISVPVAALILGISRRAMLRLLARGLIPWIEVEVGGVRRKLRVVERQRVVRYLEALSGPAP